MVSLFSVEGLAMIKSQRGGASSAKNGEAMMAAVSVIRLAELRERM